MGYEPTRYLVLAVLLTSSQSSQSKEPKTKEWTKEIFPNPHRHVYDCGQRGRRSNVCDPNHIITYDEAVTLDKMIDRLKELPCPCDVCPGGKRGGYSIGIALVPMLKLTAEYDGSVITPKQLMLQIEQFAVYLRDKKWNFGICNNDIIILIVDELDIVFITTGSIAKNKVTSLCLDESNARVNETFKVGNYTQALKLLLTDFKYYFTKGGNCTVGFGVKSDWPIEAIVGVITGTLVFFIVCCVTLTRFCSGAGASGGGSSHRHHYSAYTRTQKEQRDGLVEGKTIEGDGFMIDAMIDAREEAARERTHVHAV
ncbi:uncharacterized protein LOC135483168 [Lineus longissimus]|uniref:uncharacterized protein LOC135483168 n=1 Tax=Lineus longissimus TaxID=88925 RepID=UPI002B4E5B2E